MIGYKLIPTDWIAMAKHKKYTCPGIFEEKIKPSVCRCGMHFYPTLSDLYYHRFGFKYTYGSEVDMLGWHIVLVISQGDVDQGAFSYIRKPISWNDVMTICCTNKLEIIRELSTREIEDILNHEYVQKYGYMKGGETMNAGLPRNR